MSVRPVESGRFKVVLCLCFPQSDQIFNISLPATSEGQIAPTAPAKKSYFVKLGPELDIKDSFITVPVTASRPTFPLGLLPK